METFPEIARISRSSNLLKTVCSKNPYFYSFSLGPFEKKGAYYIAPVVGLSVDQTMSAQYDINIVSIS